MAGTRVLMVSARSHPLIEELAAFIKRNNIDVKLLLFNQNSITKISNILIIIKISIILVLKNPKCIKYLLYIFKISKKLYVIVILIVYEIIKYYKVYNVRLVHAFWVYPAGYAAVFAKNIIKIPVIITPLGYDIRKPSLNNTYTREVTRYAFDRADMIIVNDAKIKNIVEKLTHRRDRVVIVPLGTNVSRFSPNINKSIIKKLYNLDNNVVIVGFGPHLKKLYGATDFIEAAIQVSRQVKNVVFIMIGRGELKEYLSKIAKDAGLKMIFTGYIPYKLMPYYYVAMDVYCSLCPLIQGISVLEAMASGTPVISYKPVYLKKSYVIDGYNGFLVKPGNVGELVKKLILIITDKNLRNKLSVNARKLVVTKYNLGKSAQIISRIYKLLIREHH